MSVTRVTHVAWNLEGGGLESLIAMLADQLHGTDVEISAISLSGQPGRVGEAMRSRLAHFEVLRPTPVVSLVAPVGLARAIRRTRADVVHLHSGAWLKGAWAARLARVRRVVYTEHGREHDDPLLRRVLDRIAARLTHTVVAVSERLRAYMTAVVHVPARRLVVIPNAVDARRFRPAGRDATVREALGVPSDGLVIGSVGRLVAVKGYDVLLRAVARLAHGALSAHPPYVVLVGDGPEREALESLARELRIEPLLRMPGWSDQPEAMYHAFDVFALSSWSEGASLSLLEAMASGVVPVVTDVGASGELVGPELKAQVVPAGAVDALADALAATLRDRGARERLAGLARRRVEEWYDVVPLVAAYRDLYRA